MTNIKLKNAAVATVQKAPRSALERHLAGLRSFVRENLTKWSHEEKEFVQAKLRGWIALIDSKNPQPQRSPREGTRPTSSCRPGPLTRRNDL